MTDAPSPKIPSVSMARQRKKLSRWDKWGKVLIVILAFYGLWLVGWEALARSGLWPSYVFPPFTPVLQAVVDNTVNGRFPVAIAASMKRLLIGYLAALGIGMALGLIMGRFQTAQITLGSMSLGLQALPSIAWLPLALIWFGLDESAIVFVIIMGVVFSIAMSTSTGIRSIPPQLERAARNMGAKGDSMVFDLVLPASLPHIVTGMKQGWSFAWRALIAAEMVYSTVGLGHMLMMGRELNDLAMVLAVMVVIVLVGLAADQLVFERLERAVHVRWGVARR